ncbi:MAG: DUF433 domain-containing protein [Saprospiraceae bacterium]
MIEIHKHIEINSSVRFGKPCITGTRITVDDILKWLSSGMSFEDIEKDFPLIQKEHILAALSFAANREESIRLILA